MLIYDQTEVKRFEAHAAAAITAAQPRQTREPGKDEGSSSRHIVPERPALVLHLFARSKYEKLATPKKTTTIVKQPDGTVDIEFTPEAAKTKALHCMLAQEIFTAGRAKTAGGSALYEALERMDPVHPYVHDGKAVPPNVLVAYMSMNPRDQVQALVDFHHRMVSSVLTGAVVPTRLDHEFVHAVHKSKASRLFVEIDVDTKDPATIGMFLAEVQARVARPPEVVEAGAAPQILRLAAFIVETRGGYHIVYRKADFPPDMYKVCMDPKFDYLELARDGCAVKKKYFDIRGDVCVPIPGTLQGGFPVRMLTADEFMQVLE